MSSGRVGYLDGVRYRTVYGWAYDAQASFDPVVVAVQINGTHAGLAVADHPRPDLAAAGLPLRSGFRWSIPDSYRTIHDVSVEILHAGGTLPHSAEPVYSPETNRNVPAEWRAGSHYCFPSFFILGAAKCGTTSLHGFLGQHPEICMSDPKEPFYFEGPFGKGVSWYFNRYFGHWSPSLTAVGEARHRNLYAPSAAARIHRYNPDARLIVCMRKPADRAVSHWWHFYSKLRDPLPLKEALAADLKRIQMGITYESPSNQDVYVRTLDLTGNGPLRTYLDSGYYLEQIERFLKLFPRSQMHFVWSEDLESNPPGVVSGVLKFLDLDPTPAVSFDYTPLNRSDPGVLDHVKPETLSWLVDHYRERNQCLSKMLGRDLSSWNWPELSKK